MNTDSLGTIVCPIDFSELSAHALHEAALLARCSASPILALHAMWHEAPAYFTEGQLTELREEARRSISDARRALDVFVAAALGSNALEVRTKVVEGLPVDQILAESGSDHAGLIVMGTHGRSGWNRWTLGSVTERVLRESMAPVLTVRSEPSSEIRRILVPVSDTNESRAALAYAANLATCFDASVTALHVVEAHSGASISNLCAWIPADARSRCLIRELALHGNAAEEIVRLASQNEYELLVLGAPKRRFFDGMVLGTTTLRAVRHAGIPVLSVPVPDIADQ